MIDLIGLWLGLWYDKTGHTASFGPFRPPTWCLDIWTSGHPSFPSAVINTPACP